MAGRGLFEGQLSALVFINSPRKIIAPFANGLVIFSHKVTLRKLPPRPDCPPIFQSKFI